MTSPTTTDHGAELLVEELLTTLSLPYCRFGEDGCVRTANREFETLLGSLAPVTGLTVAELTARTADADLAAEMADLVDSRIGDTTTSDGLPQAACGLRRLSLPDGFALLGTPATSSETDPPVDRDALTGLVGRAGFHAALDAAVRRAADTFEEVAVLYLDLDRFKPVNDMLGHEAGDRLLVEVARRIREQTRSGDVLARLGGDEFALIQVDAAQPGGSRTLARRILDALSKPFHLDGHTVGIGVSIGVAVAPFDAATGEEMLRAADLAMYAAKAAGRNVLRYFEPEMSERMQARRDVEAELRDAVPRNQLQLRYQPAKDMLSGAVATVEALVRWEHPTLGFVRPDEFIPLAEETGLILSIGEWVLRQACRDAAGWPDETCVAVNVSAVQLRSRSFVQTVLDALAAAELPPQRLELEITETAMMAETELTIAILTELRQAGVRIAMDDFGTGYSSLSYLWRFPFDKVKIDKSFTQALEDDERVDLIVGSIVSLAHSLKIRVNAEGVETESQLEALRGHGCDEFQGFLLGRPASAEATREAIDASASASAGAARRAA